MDSKWTVEQLKPGIKRFEVLARSVTAIRDKPVGLQAFRLALMRALKC